MYIGNIYWNSRPRFTLYFTRLLYRSTVYRNASLYNKYMFSSFSIRREYFVEQDNGAVLYILCKLYEQCISRFLLDLKCRYIYHVFIYILRCIFFGIVYLMYTFININGVNNLIAGILILYYINMRIIFFIQLQWTTIILWSYYIKKRKYFLAKDYASHIRYNILMLYRFSEYKVKFYYWF